MYDSVTVSEIPPNAQAVAGYVNGRWPTFRALEEGFPHARRLSIAVNASANADCLDIERGDATPEEAPAWVRRQLQRGVKRPVVYAAVSEAPLVLAVLERNGIKRDQIRLWTAHYTDRPHRCSSVCGYGFRDFADATQYTSHALGRNLDASLCSASFFFSPKPLTLSKPQLRAIILRWWRNGVGWKRIKATRVWARFRSLGGK